MTSKYICLGISIGILGSVFFYTMKDKIRIEILSGKPNQYTDLQHATDSYHDDQYESDNKKIINNLDDLKTRLDDIEKIIDQLK